jgi:hypothetical protein
MAPNTWKLRLTYEDRNDSSHVQIRRYARINNFLPSRDVVLGIKPGCALSLPLAV